MKIPQLNKLSRASQLSLLAVVILLGSVFFTLNSAMQQQNGASHASGCTVYTILGYTYDNCPGTHPILNPTCIQRPVCRPGEMCPQYIGVGYCPPTQPTATPVPPVANGNLLKNPSFESGTAYWSLNKTSPGNGSFTTTTSTAEDGNKSAMVLITVSNANDWHVQLMQNGLPVQSGQTYTVSFWAKASSNRQIESIVQQYANPYTVYVEKSYSLGTSWQKYSYTFTADASQSNAFVGFNLAKNIGFVWIDNVSYSVSGVATQPTPTATPLPTPVPTGVPTAVPTSVPSSVPTNSPTNSPTSPPPPGSTLVNVTVGLHGIGSAGDSANPGSDGNMNPLRPDRTITMDVYDAQNQLVMSQDGTMSYDSGSGKFTGTVNLGQGFSTGLYTIKIKTDQFLRAIVPGIQTITAGQTTTLPEVTLIAGDINGDNQINILDYNILMGCYSDLLPPVDCNATNEVLADLNDDGAVNQFDYNLFLRELSNVGGQ